MGKGTCQSPECDRPVFRRVWCSTHYKRWLSHGDAEWVPHSSRWRAPKFCGEEGCQRHAKYRGRCGPHHRLFHGYSKSLREDTNYGRGSVHHSGYRYLYLPDHPNASKTGRVAEHRFVMSEVIGRPLLSSETVHHKNCDRLDNRPEDLEIWVSLGGPVSGARVADVVSYAIELLKRYAPEKLSSEVPA